MKLNQLVQHVVEGFILTDTPFSVYDVTTSIRTLVNSGAVNAPDLAVSGRDFKFAVEHDEVRQEFIDLLTVKGFSNKLNKNWTGKFFEYVPSTQVTSRAKPSSGLVSSTVQTTSNSSKLDKPEVLRRVRTYLTNCDANKFTPTLKQIQSAIKRGNKSTGWSRQELDVIRREVRSNNRKKPRGGG
jgi:hypothetical protein